MVQESSDADSMIDSSQWIDLPVGYNLAEQMNVSEISPRRAAISTSILI